MDKERNLIIDIVKGVCILFVVVGHTNAPFVDFIYLFHMAVFFMVSGFCYNTKNSENSDNYFLFIKRKIITLYIPFVLWTIVFDLLHNFFLNIQFYTDNQEILKLGSMNIVSEKWTFKIMMWNIIKSFLMIGGQIQLNGTFWFFQTLFIVSILYNTIEFFINRFVYFRNCERNRVIFQSILSSIFLLFGYFLTLYNFGIVNINRVLTCYFLFHIGVLLRYTKILVRRFNGFNLLCFLFTFIVLIILVKVGSIGISTNHYGNPIFLIVASISGFLMVYEISLLITNLSLIKKFFIYCGKNSAYIMIFHFLAFKIMNVFLVHIYHYPSYMIAAFPCLINENYFWIMYSVIGIFIPMIITIFIKKIKGGLKRDDKCMYGNI